MAKFMLARGQRPGAYPGVKLEERPGNLPPLRRMVDVVFPSSMKAVEAPEGVDLSNWVESGHLIEVKATKKVAPKPPPEDPPEDPEDDEPEDDDTDDDTDGDGNGDYEEIVENGKTKYKCLHCGHVLKTEQGMIDHVEDKHR